MDFIKELDDNSFLLIPNNIKDKVLDYIDKNNLLLNIKFLSFNDLKNGLIYSYDNKAIYYLMNEKNISYSLAKSYIDDTYYINQDSYKEDKLKYLLDIKNYLFNNDLLIKDDLFKDLLKSKKKLYVYGYDYINKFNNYLLSLAKEYIKVEELDKPSNEYEHVVHVAKTMEEEVLYVAEEISKLIKDGVSLDKIYITGLDNECDFTLRRIFKAYNIPYFIKNNNILYDTAIAKYFFNNLDNNVEELLTKIKKKYNIDNNMNNMAVYNKLVNLVNKYYFIDDYNKVKNIMIEEAKTSTLPSIHMEHEITTTNIYNNIFDDDEYVFLMNFNMGVFPKVKKDEDYINDSIKPDIMETSKEYNKNNKEALLKIIKNIKNLYITYKLSSPFNKYYPSYIIEGNYKEEDINFNVSNYSNDINKLLFAKKLDNLIKFNEKHDSLGVLNNSYNIPYNQYKNDFKGLDVNIKKINYSYSNISEYYKCPFRFYCEKVLNMDEFSQSIATFIGSLFHGVLETCLQNPDLDIDEEYDRLIKDNESLPDDDTNKYITNNHDKYFIEKVRKELHVIIDIIREQYKKIGVPFKVWPEYPINEMTQDIGINTKINAVIKGYVDKCIVFDNNIYVIDYKTGDSDKIVRDMFEFGLHIQLPLYLYLLEKTKPECNVAGIYLQYILNGNNKKDDKKTQEEVKINDLKLDGITLDDRDILSKFDTDYQNSTVIQALKETKEGKLPEKRIMTYEQKDKLKDIMEKLIINCIDNVYDSNFEIAPIYIEKRENGCKFCKFRDVCYRKDNQYKYITMNEEGDENE